MARLARIEIAGCPHHVIQRGNNRESVFRDEPDRHQYLALLREIASTSSLAVHAYVLMPDHVHLLVTPQSEGALGRAMQAIGRRYVRWFNDRHRRTGTLWEGRFRSAPISAERYLLTCMRYIELNPVRAGISSSVDQYPWSSFAHHIGLTVDPLITDHAVFWGLGNTPFERQSAYRRLCEDPLPLERVDELRWATKRGWALTQISGGDVGGDGRAAWAKPRPRGRPPKRPKDDE
jgi:putative transposase